MRFSCEYSFSSHQEKKDVKIDHCVAYREIAYLLSHLRSVTEHLEPSWARAFLKRTRFLEPEFQGDVLAVISEYLPSLSLSLLLTKSFLQT